MTTKRHQLLDPGATVSIVNGGQIHIIAAAGQDGLENNGAWIPVDNRFGVRYGILWRTTLAAAETFTLSFNLQDATDASGTGAADFGTAYPATVQATGALTNQLGVTYLDKTLTDARTHIRVQYTGDLSAGATDTLDMQVFMLFSEQNTPVA